MNRRGTRGSGDLREYVGRMAVLDQELSIECGIEFAQRIHEIPPAHRTSGSPQHGIDHEQWNDAPITCCLRSSNGRSECRVVGDAQIAAKPHDGRHLSTLWGIRMVCMAEHGRGVVAGSFEVVEDVCVSDLIDTTEMYLRTIYELEEEGVVPMRARIAERLGQSGPTVSQTTARMERDGLLALSGDRHIELTPFGRATATRVMRKHRLAECLLAQVIELPWELIHEEACRWEHVISDTVEQRLLELLNYPTVSPFGNPIPGLDEFNVDSAVGDAGLAQLDEVAVADVQIVRVKRIGEPVQDEAAIMTSLRRAGALPGAVVKVQATEDGVLIGSGGEYAELPHALAAHVFIEVAG